MPRFDRFGRLYCGQGDGEGSIVLEGHTHLLGRIAHGIQPLDDRDDNPALTTVIFQTKHEGRYVLGTLSEAGGFAVVAGSTGASFLAAGAGRFLAWISGRGLYGVITDPAAGVSPTSTDGRGTIASDGTLAYKPSYHGNIIHLVAANGEFLAELPAVAGLQVISRNEAIWNGGARGFNPRRLAGEAYTRVAVVNGVRWLVSWQNGLERLIAHPEHSFVGYVVTTGHAFHHDACAKDGRLLAGYCTNVQESPGSGVVVDVFALPEVDLGEQPNLPIPEPEPINREGILAFYEQKGTPESHGKPLAPGNAENATRNYPANAVRPRPVIVTEDVLDEDGNIIDDGTIGTQPEYAVRVGSESGDAAPAEKLQHMIDKAWRLHNEGHRIDFYWDDRWPPFWPQSLPPGTIWQIQTFWYKDETLDQLEEDMADVIEEAGMRYGKVTLAVQSHTTNGALSDNIRPLPAMATRLWNRFPQWIIGLEPFNHSGRDYPDGSKGGLTANEYMRSTWETIASTITSLIDWNSGGGGGPVPELIVIHAHTKEVSRQNFLGYCVVAEFDPSVKDIEIGLDDGTELVKLQNVGSKDSHNFRGMLIKPTVNGDFAVKVRAKTTGSGWVEKMTVTKTKVTADPVSDPFEQTFEFFR